MNKEYWNFFIPGYPCYSTHYVQIYHWIK